MKWFNVVHNDGAVRVRIDDERYATLVVEKIEDSQVLIKAINQTFRAGAVRGTLYTGDLSHDQLARMGLMRAGRATTWLDGKVTRLEDGDLGPRFRVDWDVMPFITE